MQFKPSLAVLVLMATVSPCFAADPTVSNVRAQQLADGTKRVEVLYNLAGAPAGGATVTVVLSQDSGATYTITPAASTLSGDVGAGITSGTNRRIVWNAPLTLAPEFYKKTMRASVTAVDPAANPPTVAPSLSATPQSASSIALNWGAVAGAMGYRLYRVGWSSAIYAGPNLVYTDTGRNSGTQYCYKVGAYNTAGDGPLSEQQCATTLGAAPADAPNLTATAQSPTAIGLSWSAVGGATGYRLYRVGRSSAIYAGPNLVYTDAGRNAGTQYCYKVRAYNSAGEGPLSQQACATASDEGGGAEITVDLPGGVSLVMAKIPAGTFMMGAPAGEPGSNGGDGPQHLVTITQPFYLGRTEVTQAQWQAVMGTNPATSPDIGPDYPVFQVSWDDIAGTGGFIEKLNQQQGTMKFRLPTEAEWEYAARAGTTTAFSFPTQTNYDTECGSFPEAVPYMWWCNNSGGRHHPVGRKLANPWGFFDMHGNVCEWVNDWWGDYPSAAQIDPHGPASGLNRVFRGGNYAFWAWECLSAKHSGEGPDARVGQLGFRLARSQ